MSLVDALRCAENPVREYLYTTFPNTKPITKDAREWLRLTPTILPSHEVPWSIIGKAFDLRIRYYFQSHPAYLPWSGKRNLEDDPRIIRSLPTEHQFIPGLFREFSARLDEALKRLKPVGRRLEQTEELELGQYCILLAMFQQWNPYSSHRTLFSRLNPPKNLSAVASIVKPLWLDDLCQLSWLFYDRQCFLLSFPAIFEASFGVRWACADMIVDNRVIEIKTTKDPSIKKSWIYQVVAYALLADTGSYRSREAGIYMSRQGFLCSWPLPWLLNVLHGGKIRSIRKLRMEFQRICGATVLGVGKVRSVYC